MGSDHGLSAEGESRVVMRGVGRDIAAMVVALHCRVLCGVSCGRRLCSSVMNDLLPIKISKLEMKRSKECEEHQRLMLL